MLELYTYICIYGGADFKCDRQNLSSYNVSDTVDVEETLKEVGHSGKRKHVKLYEEREEGICKSNYLFIY